jgi:LysR family nitrogen assimilation transcriptional regulator
VGRETAPAGGRVSAEECLVRSYAHFDITGLHYFAVVAEERSFSRASARLRIAQPAISRKIKALEDDLAVQLFIRHTRGVDLTEQGASLLRHAYTLFRQIEALRDSAASSGDAPAGLVTVGVLPTPGEYIVPRLVEQCARLHPGIRFRFVEGYSGDLHRMLIQQEINLAVMHAPRPHPDIAVTELLLDYLCLVGPPGSLHRPAYSFAEAAACPLILPDPPNLLRLRVEQIAAERGARLNVAMACNGFWLVKAMIHAGLGHTMVTFGSVMTERAEGRLAVAPIVSPDLPWVLAVAVRADQQRRLAVVAVRRLIETVVAGLRADDIWKQLPDGAATAATPPGPT